MNVQTAPHGSVENPTVADLRVLCDRQDSGGVDLTGQVDGYRGTATITCVLTDGTVCADIVEYDDRDEKVADYSVNVPAREVLVVEW